MNAYFPSTETVYSAILDSRKSLAPQFNYTAQQDGRGGWTVDTFNADGGHVNTETAKVDYKGGNLVIEYI